MTGELILLTGGTGHIGFRTLVEALRKGYNVRAAVRRESSIAELKATKSVQPYLANLSFVIVPDITIDGAFDQAVKNVDYIVHLASPLARPSDDLEATIIQPAIHGTLSILYSALKESSVKRVVITASIASVMPPLAWTGDTSLIVTPNDVISDPSGPYANYFAAYAASKVLSFNKTSAFIEKEKPGFSVIRILPSFVVGKNELATTRQKVADGSNSLALNPILGVKNPAGLTALTVHVDDVALVHIAALDTQKVPGNPNFGAVYNGLNAGIQWDDALDIVRKHFPKEVESGLFPLDGTQTSVPCKFDATETEKVFGFQFKDFEEQIVSVAGAYAEAA